MTSKNFTPLEYKQYQLSLKQNKDQIKQTQINIIKEWIQNKDKDQINQIKLKLNIKRLNYKYLSFEVYLNLVIIMICEIINNNQDELLQLQKQQKEKEEGKRYENAIVQLLREKLDKSFNIYQPSYSKAPWDFSFNLFDIQIPVNTKAASKKKNSLQELSSFWLFYYMFVQHQDINQVMQQFVIDGDKEYYSDGNPHYDFQLNQLIQAIQTNKIALNIEQSYLFLIQDKVNKQASIVNSYYMKDYKYLINQKEIRTKNGWKELIANQDSYLNAYQNFIQGMLCEFNENKQQYLQLIQQIETNKSKRLYMIYQIIKTIKPISKEELLEELDKQNQKTRQEIEKIYE